MLANATIPARQQSAVQGKDFNAHRKPNFLSFGLDLVLGFSAYTTLNSMDV